MKPPAPKQIKYQLNPIAQIFLLVNVLVKALVAGRGFGKTFLLGAEIAKKIEQLPRSKGLLVCQSYTHLLTEILLPMQSSWQMMGYVDGIHYVVGKVPPPWFKHPYHKPKKYENYISWWNGTVIRLGSFDRPDLMLGGSNDWVIVDECLKIRKDLYDNIVVPTLRPTHPELRDKPGHLQQIFVSSMPFGNYQKWILDIELLAKSSPEKYFYIEGTSWHNRDVLGDNTIKNWYPIPSFLYSVQVMNRKPRNYGSLFYPCLLDKHWYDSTDYSLVDKAGFDIPIIKAIGSLKDSDCNRSLPLHISHDWGAFNCLTVGQHDKDLNELRFINYMHVQHPLIIDDLALAFVAYYKHHTNKVAYQWGDKSGNKREANSKLTYFKTFADILRANGWAVIQCRVGDVEHMERHRFINRLHKEDTPRLPKVRYNSTNCKDLRIALESAGMNDDHKDKSSEGNPAIKQEHATHGTDAHDYWLYHYLIAKDSNTNTNHHSEISFGG